MFVGLEGIAQILDVGESRVRQLIGQAGFPRPLIALGPRNRVWSSAAIEAWARGRGRDTTLSLGTLPHAAGSLPRVLDEMTVVSLPRVGWAGAVYVRAWQGDGFVVALVADTESASGGITGRIERVLEVLVSQFPRQLSGEVCWVQDQRVAGPARMSNVVLTRLAEGVFQDPSWLPAPYSELVAVVGEKVEIYPAQMLTEENVREVSRRGAPIEVAVDAAWVRGRLDELRVLAHAPLGEESLAVARDFIAQSLQVTDQTAQYSVGGPLGAAEWDRGVEDVIWAVRRVYRGLSEEARELASRYYREDDWSDAVKVAAIEDLLEWAASVDEYSASPDLEAADVGYRLAQGVVITVRDEQLRDEVQLKASYRADMRVVSMNIEYPWVQKYLEGRDLTTVPSEHRLREQRILARALRVVDDSQLRFGRDRFGNHIASDGRETQLAVLWPVAAPQGVEPDQIQLEGDRDTIAYLMVNGEMQGLMPRVRPPGFVDWAIGYGGAGPSDLASAIIDYLEVRGLEATWRTAYDIVSDPGLGTSVTIPVSGLLTS